LVPLTVSAIDVEEGVSGINGLIISLRLNGLGLIIEIPLLSISSIWSLDDKSVANEINVSVVRQLRNDMEWFSDLHSPFFVVSLVWNLWRFINIDNVPLLMFFSFGTLVLSNNLSVFGILFALSCDNLSFLVGDISVLVLEHLVPD